MSKKPTYEELEIRLAKAKAHLEAIRDGQVDASAGSEQLAETQQSLARQTEELVEYRDHLQELVEKRTAELTQVNKNLVLEIEERKRAEESLKNSEKLLRTIAENYPNSYLSIVERDFTVGFTSGGEFTKQGLDPNAFVGLTIDEVLGEYGADALATVKEQYQKTFDGEETEFELFLNNQHQRYHAVPLANERGKINRILSVVENITERKRAEERLAELFDLNQKIVSTSPIGIAISTKDGQCILVNQAMATIVGATQEQILAQNIYNIPSWKRAGMLELAEKTMHLNQPHSGEFHIVTTFGVDIWLDVYFTTFIRGGEPHLLVMTNDILERKQAEEALRESENRYRVLFDSMLDGFALHEIICDDKGRPIDYLFLQVNPAFEEMTGLASDVVKGKTVRQALPLVEDYWIETYGQVALTGESIRFDNFSQELGKHFEVLAYSPKRGQFATVFTDVTERKRAEQEIGRLHEQTQQDAATKATLLKEVNHRVGNNLTALIAIFSLEQDRTEVDPNTYQTVMADLIIRVHGLATVHQILSATEWSPPLLSELAEHIIGSALQSLPQGKHVSVEVLPSALRVSPKIASNLALVLNELTTNSIKYAWPKRQNGRITVHIEQQKDVVVIEFRNDGEAYPQDVLTLEQHNVGWELIQNIICHGMGGEVTLRNDPGAVTVLRFPNPS